MFFEEYKKSKRITDLIKNLPTLYKTLEDFDGCNLKETTTHTVIFDGNPLANVMLIGEAPGFYEDQKGIPFCGKSGQLLDNIIKSIDFSRKTVYITNTVFWRPPDNRRPTQQELMICKPFVEKHIALIQPKLIILVGHTAVQSLLPKESNKSMAQLRNRYWNYSNDYLGNTKIKMVAIYHPSYLLRSPYQKKEMWYDILKIKQNFCTDLICT